ncbi:MAG: hypothetical protein ETSY1_30230 [Candidatus Entotheonella factor]|uniref:Peptidase C14 caspase domain-containing protein n=1 Tax=Entotheonella factor TaxID=1429438 RepID=W4LBQ0_ENTF1|nr:MAG: hypothetical protein ETSY1_30230 [Candidatus Entotheonella factor]
MQDGKELLALFPHADRKRWVLWTPQGYYQASAGAEDLIGWHLNNGADKTPDFYSVSRFREHFYRPDVIARVLDTLDVDEALQLANQARGRKTITRDLRTILPPTVMILEPKSGTKWDTKRLVLIYHASSTTGPILNTEARINGRPATVLSEARMRGNEQEFVQKIEIEIPPEDAEVTLLAKNKHGWSEPAAFFVNWAGAKDWYKPELYILAIGVSQYGNPERNLQYAAKDASDFIEAFKAQKGGLYKNITIRPLLNDAASRDAILDGLDWLERQTTNRDVAMVFLSGHGITGPGGEYRFLPPDVDEVRLKRTSVRASDFLEFLGKIAGKAVLFFDTCHSGDVFGGTRTDSQADVDKFANQLAAAESGVIVFTSSSGKQFSKEDAQWENGAFTEALLEGIRGMADFSKDWYISIAELEEYLGDRVKELTDGAQTPKTAKPRTVENLRIARIRR